MNAPLRTPWTQEEFFTWAGAQEARYEFDGFEPVAMTGGTVNHNIITQNIHAALRIRLRGSACRPLGPDVGVATVGDAIRYPDALVTCAKLSGEALVAPDPVVVFEVVSASSGPIDRTIKVREYASVPSIRRYIIAESTSSGLVVHSRDNPDQLWTAMPLTADDRLEMPEISIGIPVSEFYEDVVLA
jgi:Uma2 family endonuclease